MKFRAALLVIVLVAGWLRFQSIDFGAPCHGGRLGEELILREALHLVDGDPHIHFHRYPAGFVLLCAGWFRLLMTFGFLPSEGLLSYAETPMPFHVAARSLVALLGTLTVAIVGLAAARAAGRWGGIIAALLLAIMPLHVLHSHFATLDVPGTLFVALTLLCCFKPRGGMAGGCGLVAGAVCAGLAAGMKYPHGAAVLAPLGLALTGMGTGRIRRILAVGTSFGLALIVACPTIVFDFDAVRADVAAESLHQRIGHDNWTGEAPWRLLLRVGVYHGTGMGPAVLAALVVIMLGWRRSRWIFVLAPFVALVFVHATSGRPFVRYMMPCSVAVAWIAGSGVGRLATLSRSTRLRGLLVVTVVAAVFPAWLRTVETMRVLRQDDTRADLLRAFDDGRLPRDLVVLRPSFPFQVFPDAWNRTLLAVQADREDDCPHRTAIMRSVARRLLASDAEVTDDTTSTDRVDVRVVTPQNLDRTLASLAGREVLFVIPKSFTDHYDWWDGHLRSLIEERSEALGVEPVLQLHPNPERGFPDPSEYDIADVWYLPFPRASLVDRPGPAIDVYRVKLPGS